MNMNALDEAIKFCNDKLEDFTRKANAGCGSDEYDMDDCYRYATMYAQMAVFLKTLKAYREADRWIPVSERLPDDMQKVLIWFEYYRYGDFNCMYQTYGFGYVCDGKWSPFINGETGWQDYNIIAWQPLPEPYKKGGAE